MTSKYKIRVIVTLNTKNMSLSNSMGTQFYPEFVYIQCFNCMEFKPEDYWSCIAHLSAEDILKSAVIGEKKFKHSPMLGADNPLGPKFLCQQEGLITMVICCKFKKNHFSL